MLLLSVYDLAFKPDGSQLIVAAGLRVLVRLSSVHVIKHDAVINTVFDTL